MFLGGHLDGERFICQSRALLPFSHNRKGKRAPLCSSGRAVPSVKRVRVRSYPVAIESGEELQKGPYVAETFPVHVEDSYVIIET
jgi:hypothetical protein